MGTQKLRKKHEKLKDTLPRKLKGLKQKLERLKRRRKHSRVAPRARSNNTPAHESRLYSDYALLYDKTFGNIFSDRIRHVIKTLHIPARARVLELGVGTGTSFPAYPGHCRVVGIDLAADMLAQARRKISKNAWSHLQVLEMDALNLGFVDDSFDYITAFHTVTVVPDPIQMLKEAKRVCRPGGKIVIVNHFTTDLPIIGPLTEALDPVTRRLGWRTDLKLKPFLEATNFHVEKNYKLSKLSLYTVIVGVNHKNGLPDTR